MKPYTLLIALLLAITGLQAQVTAERVVFSSLGGFSTTGSLSFSTTGGETLIGTSTTGSFSFLQGFQIPNAMAVGLESPLGSNLQVSIFPNPVSDEIHIHLEGTLTETIHLELYDVTGRAVSGWPLDVHEAGVVKKDLSELSSGAYFLHLRQVDGTLFQTLPVIKQ